MAVVTDVGAGWIASRIRNGVSLTTLYIGAGTGTNDLAKTKTALVTPVSEARVAGTHSNPSSKVLRVYAEITFTGTKTIKEVGIFTASKGGTLIAMDTLNQAVNNGDKIQFTFDIPISN